MILNMEQMAKEVAQRVLDEAMYEGKTFREWIEIFKSRPPMVHAMWIKDDSGHSCCSNCSHRLPFVHCYDEYEYLEWDEEIDETPFCPWCNAIMDEQEIE